MITFTHYITAKLKHASDQIRVLTNRVIEHANSLDIKALMGATDNLNRQKEEHRQLSKDATKHLDVKDFIDLYQQGLIDEYSAGHSFQYDRTVSLFERQQLEKLHYRFKDAKVA